ncbi:ABC-F family ATP-binding cassette domain-containing protein [bacterium]|nr:ABC-F family ATP-binding cassette domain-containing protein [Akkermansiaceae bacterium]MDA7935921.1 ABC-F family ATP-binding cassette domain-containing protein [bacterium]MDA7519383.1 ABC-F family ATP-binding cassette domain-containing protein [Akkermansiaceae bacterium]MDA7629695.1 ABC-F family ATP-binding cassette domain-containing protein [Akkermansiaceae bacterium]MDB0055713.1 ABC-F family ATP-binding cassette domain-containing protein [Akkermansiaceae bacterium]
MLAVKNLRVEFGPRVIFKDLTFSVGDKERIAFAGHNGAGKSTLMKCIGGALLPNGGEINKPKHHRIGYLPQEGIHIKGISLYDEAESAFAETKAIQEKIDRYAAELEKLDPCSAPFSDMLERIGELELLLDGHDPARMKPRIQSILTGLGFKRSDFTRDCGEFSGGWQMRIAMAKLFLAEPEVLLLDEPTNHLDIGAQRFMENYLHSYKGAIILISHDRSMMDGLTTRTIAFHHGRAEEFTGNYSSYESQLKERQDTLRKQKIAQDREIAKSQQFIDRFRASANKATLVQSRIKLLAKVERIQIDAEESSVAFRFPDPPSSTHLVAKLDSAAQVYPLKNGEDLTVFRDLDFEITRGEKIAIVGPNGAGKSTFCRMITGEEDPSTGEHEMGPKSLPSFFNQNHADELDPDLTVLETIEQIQTRGATMTARDVLGCFLFRGDDVFKKVGVLSGGERSRVALVRMLVRPANFLILDEPTNHLDMKSQDILQKALMDYPGTLLIVSHNRNFLDPIVGKTMEFRPGEDPRLFAGNLTYYLNKIEEDEGATKSSAEQEAPKLASQKPSQPKGPRLNPKERRKRDAAIREKRNKVLKPLQSDLVKTEAVIAEIEASQATITQRMDSPEISGDPEKLAESTRAYANLAEKLEKAYSKWTDLSASIEKVEAELEV